MKSKDLIELLKQYPEANVSITTVRHPRTKFHEISHLLYNDKIGIVLSIAG